jgi:hypothetical protein
MTGFGDFLIVGDSYCEGGGPAYAVAIHLTFIDPDKDDVMYVYHFVSTTKDTPTDPAGKFAQALKKLIDKLNTGNSKLLETDAIKEFREFYAKGHFPDLGYVKKLVDEAEFREPIQDRQCDIVGDRSRHDEAQSVAIFGKICESKGQYLLRAARWAGC